MDYPQSWVVASLATSSLVNNLFVSFDTIDTVNCGHLVLRTLGRGITNDGRGDTSPDNVPALSNIGPHQHLIVTTHRATIRRAHN